MVARVRPKLAMKVDDVRMEVERFASSMAL
jgi:hypothetical protein